MIKLKTAVKCISGKVIGASYDEMVQAVNKAEVISFDIFDTLVKRNVMAPKDVHNIVHNSFQRQTGKDINGYLELRVNAERAARKRSIKEEISLEDIFNCMGGISDSDKNKLQEIEKETELEICCPDLRMKTIYDKALKDGKHIIITSDMYLEEKIIKKILNKCGYEHYEKLYLSSSFGLCKSKGSIYDVIKKDYSDFKGKILHIGDNIKGDYFVAKRKGLDALLIDGQRNLLRYWKKNNKNIENQFLYGNLYSFINNHIGDGAGDDVHIAYEVLGPMLLGYCIWLNEKIKNDNIEKIFFLSREGKIIQEAFNILYPQNKIHQTYLYVSRQALVVPLLADVDDFDTMIDVLKVFLHIPVLKTIRILCGLEQKKFNEKLILIGLNEETKIYEIPNKKKPEVYNIIQELGGYNFKQQKEYVIKYLKENDFSGNIAIVDIGWVGTMQMALQKYVREPDTIIYGYYLGIRNMEAEDYYANFNRSGYLFEIGKYKDFDLMARFTTEIFEILFLNQMGSVIGYALDKETVVPILNESEYNGYEGKFIENVQSIALSFLDIIKENKIFKDNIKMQVDIIMSAYSHFAVYPNNDTIRIFENFPFFNGGKLRRLLPQHGLLYYIFHVKELKGDFNECHCKILLMKRLLKINLPYFDLLKFLVVKCNFTSLYQKKYYKKNRLAS